MEIKWHASPVGSDANKCLALHFDDIESRFSKKRADTGEVNVMDVRNKDEAEEIFQTALSSGFSVRYFIQINGGVLVEVNPIDARRRMAEGW